MAITALYAIGPPEGTGVPPWPQPWQPTNDPNLDLAGLRCEIAALRERTEALEKRIAKLIKLVKKRLPKESETP